MDLSLNISKTVDEAVSNYSYRLNRKIRTSAIRGAVVIAAVGSLAYVSHKIKSSSN